MRELKHRKDWLTKRWRRELGAGDAGAGRGRAEPRPGHAVDGTGRLGADGRSDDAPGLAGLVQGQQPQQPRRQPQRQRRRRRRHHGRRRRHQTRERRDARHHLRRRLSTHADAHDRVLDVVHEDTAAGAHAVVHAAAADDAGAHRVHDARISSWVCRNHKSKGDN